jgi:hypothetical protein
MATNLATCGIMAHQSLYERNGYDVAVSHENYDARRLAGHEISKYWRSRCATLLIGKTR